MAFSLRDFCEPGDTYTDFSTGDRGIVSEILEDGSVLSYPVKSIDPVSMSLEEQAEAMRSVVLQVRRNYGRL